MIVSDNCVITDLEFKVFSSPILFASDIDKQILRPDSSHVTAVEQRVARLHVQHSCFLFSPSCEICRVPQSNT